jgi:hypothetical protein
MKRKSLRCPGSLIDLEFKDVLKHLTSSHSSFRSCFSPYHRFQTGSGAHPASYTMGIKGSFPGSKWPGRDADHSPPFSAEVKNAWSYTSIPQYAFMVLCSVTKKKHRDNFII